MLGKFMYHNPTALYFGEGSISNLDKELPKYGSRVVLVYGGGSIKKSGLYQQVLDILKKHQKVVAEISGVMSNPTLDKVYEGIEIARQHQVDFFLAVGGGSVCDYTKAVAISVHCDEDPWELYYKKFKEPTCPVVPLGCILTMAGTGSEMNAGAVITNTKTKQKIGHVFTHPDVKPKFSILDPTYTYTLPEDQMVSGIYDMFCHICEQYFSNEDDNTSDYLAEGLMRSIIHSGLIAKAEPTNYEARSNLMWSATWALNTLLSRGKRTDWMVHMIGQAVGGFTNAPHGLTLSAVTLPYYRLILNDGLAKFKRFAIEVWRVDPTGKTDEAIAQEGLCALENWMRQLGVALSIRDFGVTSADLPLIAQNTIILKGGYRILTKDEILHVLTESLQTENQ